MTLIFKFEKKKRINTAQLKLISEKGINNTQN